MIIYIRSWRLHVGLSQVEAARRAGIEQTYWSALERGQHDLRATSLERIAVALGIEPADLFRQPVPEGE